jgi:HEPN domain-containing protein
VSGNYVKRLKERSLNALDIAKTTGYLNWKAFLAEQALQLYIKAIYYELFGEKLRGHEVRSLMGQLTLELEKNGFVKEAKKLKDFVIKNRDALIFLEDSYTESRYGEGELDEKIVIHAVKIVEELILILEEVVKSVKLG